MSNYPLRKCNYPVPGSHSDRRTRATDRARCELCLIGRRGAACVRDQVVTLDGDVSELLALGDTAGQLPVDLIFRSGSVRPAAWAALEVAVQ